MKNKTAKSETKSKNPLVSVVMPTYNSEKYIAETIESVLKQTYKHFEFIIINDGSSDNTLNIIKSYAKKDKRIILIDNEENLGNSRTRNKGISLSKGKYIFTQDSDDISVPNRMDDQVKFMEKNQKISVVGGYIELFDGESRKVLGIRTYPEKDEDLRKIIFFMSPFAQPATMIRKSAIIEAGLYMGRLLVSEDLDLWFRIGTYGKFANIGKILVKYRVHKNSLTGKKLNKMEKVANKIRWENRSNNSYNFGIKAFIYNSLHKISIYTIPSKLKSWVFTKLRDSKNEWNNIGYS